MPTRPVDDVQAEIASTFKELTGAEISFAVDADLTKLRKGPALTMGELRALPDNTPVYVTYKEHGSRGYRINAAMRASRDAEGKTWILTDGSSFGADFSPDCLSDDSPCTNECCGEGDMRLYRVKA